MLYIDILYYALSFFPIRRERREDIYVSIIDSIRYDIMAKQVISFIFLIFMIYEDIMGIARKNSYLLSVKTRKGSYL
jgi:hypothetical protein